MNLKSVPNKDIRPLPPVITQGPQQLLSQGDEDTEHRIFDYKKLLLHEQRLTAGDLQHLLWRSGFFADAKALADNTSPLKHQLLDSVLEFLEEVCCSRVA